MYTGLSKNVSAKLSDTCSVRADVLCIGCPKLILYLCSLVGSRMAGN